LPPLNQKIKQIIRGNYSIAVMNLTFRRCLQENNIFPAIVFGHLLKNFKSLSQPKLPEIEVKCSR